MLVKNLKLYRLGPDANVRSGNRRTEQAGGGMSAWPLPAQPVDATQALNLPGGGAVRLTACVALPWGSFTDDGMSAAT